MKPALVLIDLQRDFLSATDLQPAAGFVVSAAARLLEACRSRRVPVVHILTTVHREPDDRMPHWRKADRWCCVAGSPGHSPPELISPSREECVIHKRFFSGFGSGDLDEQLRATGCDTLILAGVHLHACVRATAFDAYERGYKVFIAEDAVASDDPIHAAISRRYLECRAAEFVAADRLIALIDGTEGGNAAFTHFSPDDRRVELWRNSALCPSAISAATAAARSSGPKWYARDPQSRADVLRRWAAKLLEEGESLAVSIATDIDKPITQARAEIRRSADLLEATAGMALHARSVRSTKVARYQYVPLGVVAILTPYNNPVAIPIGKIGPALLFGNAVVWKPAPAASRVGRLLLEIAHEAGVPKDVLTLCTGDREAAIRLAEDENVDGVTISGSALAGYAIQDICARRHVPYQGELGGNNAAIVWQDADLSRAASAIAAGAFAFAGQRCTANRRVIVAEAVAAGFLAELERATARLRWGDPLHAETIVGPLVSIRKRDEVDSLVLRATADGLRAGVPHRNQSDFADLIARGAYYPPTILLAGDGSHEIVQEETFGPVLVVQQAQGFDRALELCNGVTTGASFLPEMRMEHLRRTRQYRLRRAISHSSSIHLAQRAFPKRSCSRIEISSTMPDDCRWGWN
jgi:acyl-CoA reductase-like NAD-dependent aldehyde dehydrogenase